MSGEGGRAIFASFMSSFLFLPFLLKFFPDHGIDEGLFSGKQISYHYGRSRLVVMLVASVYLSSFSLLPPFSFLSSLFFPRLSSRAVERNAARLFPPFFLSFASVAVRNGSRRRRGIFRSCRCGRAPLYAGPFLPFLPFFFYVVDMRLADARLELEWEGVERPPPWHLFSFPFLSLFSAVGRCCLALGALDIAIESGGHALERSFSLISCPFPSLFSRMIFSLFLAVEQAEAGRLDGGRKGSGMLFALFPFFFFLLSVFLSFICPRNSFSSSAGSEATPVRGWRLRRQGVGVAFSVGLPSLLFPFLSLFFFFREAPLPVVTVGVTRRSRRGDRRASSLPSLFFWSRKCGL